MKRCITFILSAVLLLSVFSIFSVCSAAETNYDTSWYNTSDKVLYLRDTDDFLGFGYLLASQKKNFSGQTIELLCDVTINDVDLSADDLQTNALILWYNTGEQNFAGIFEGNEHTVSGLYYSSTKTNVGIFGRPQGTSACVRNLSIVNSLIVSSTATYVGAIFGQMSTSQTVTLENLYVDVDIRCSTSNANVGGLIGLCQASLLDADSCVFAGTITVSSAKNLGGLIGIANHGSFSVNDCAFYGNLNASVGSVGGVIGTADVAGGISCSIVDAEISFETERKGIFYGSSSAAVTLKNNLYAANGMSPIPGASVAETISGQYVSVQTKDLMGLEAMLTLAQYGLNNWKAALREYALPRQVASMRHSDIATEEPMQFGTKLVGYQLSQTITDSFSLRIVGVVDSLSYEAIGLEVLAYGEHEKIGKKEQNRQFQSVYRSITGYGSDETRVDYTAQNLGGAYIFALNINNIPVRCGTIHFTLQSYHVSGGKTIPDGEQILFDLNTDVLGTAEEAK